MLVQAHRGASAYAPENTLPAFELAVKMGADGIECDIHMTKDGEVVVCHDPTIDRTSNGTGQIKDYTLAELRQFDFGIKFDPRFAGTRIPTLDEMLEVVGGLQIINIEAKNPLTEGRYPELLEKTAEIAKMHGVADKVIISSFDHGQAALANKVCPAFKSAILYGKMDNDTAYAKQLGVDALHPGFWEFTEDKAKEAIRAGLLVNVWTVDNKEDMERMKSWGVTSIITNRPDIGLEVAHQK